MSSWLEGFQSSGGDGGAPRRASGASPVSIHRPGKSGQAWETRGHTGGERCLPGASSGPGRSVPLDLSGPGGRPGGQRHLRVRGEPGMPRSVAAGDDTFDTASDGSCVEGGQARVLDGGIRGAAVGLAGNSGYQRASTDIGALYGVGSRQCPRVRTPLAGHGAVRVEWNQGRSRVRRASATKRPHPAPVLRLPG